MGVNLRNSEGYYDPTAFQALTNIAREAKAKRACNRNKTYIPGKYKPKHTTHIASISRKEDSKT